MKYHIVTYGCQMNLHESEKIAAVLRGKGYEGEAPAEEADIIVFNTCCIRENAENHAFGNIGALKRLKREKKGLIIAVGGCMVREDGKAALLKEKFPFIDILFGTHDLARLGDLIERKRREKKTVVCVSDAREETEDGIVPVRTSYPNAWVNVMYGCDNFCSYCIVPYVRGRERSRAARDVLREVESLAEAGYREITLLGQNVDSYRDGDIGFPALLDAVASVKGDFRVRFMTSHPKDFSPELVSVMKAHDKICKHLHLPVQSGSDRILSLMNRRYTRARYLEEIALLRREIPECAVSTDLIVGFPTETEEDFAETLSLVSEVGFSSAFTFAFSPRTGTKAAAMEGRVPEEVAKERLSRLIERVNENTRRISASYLGKTVRILTEDYDEKQGLLLGRDEFGRMGYFKGDRRRVGEFVRLRIDRANGISLYGEEQTGE